MSESPEEKQASTEHTGFIQSPNTKFRSAEVPLHDSIEAQFRNKIIRPTFLNWKPRSTKEETRLARQRIENRGRALDISLKKWSLIILFTFLAFETLVIFRFAFFQATGIYKFHLEEWSFKLLVFATITQITIMLQVAIKHLFPHK